MSGRDGVPKLPVGGLGLGSVTRETVMQIGWASTSMQASAKSTQRESVRNTPRASAMASPRYSERRSAANSRLSSRVGSPLRRMPTARMENFSRAGSSSSQVESTMDRAGTYNHELNSSKMMAQLYEEREEKRRLLHLMRQATGPDPHAADVEPWKKQLTEAGGVERWGLTSRSTRGRALEQSTSNGYYNSGVERSGSADGRIRPHTDRPREERPSAAKTPDGKSSSFGFMLPFDVSLPSFPNVFQAKPEDTISLDPRSKNWMQSSPVVQQQQQQQKQQLQPQQNGWGGVGQKQQQPPQQTSHQQQELQTPQQQQQPPPSRRGLDFFFQSVAPHIASSPQKQQTPAELPCQEQHRQAKSSANTDKGAQKQQIMEDPHLLEELRFLKTRVYDLEDELQKDKEKLEEQDEAIAKWKRERGFLVKKCAALSVGVQQVASTGADVPMDSAAGASQAQVADLQSKLDAALLRVAALEREVQQVWWERDEAVQDLAVARKERDEAICRQIQQQKMLVERSGNVQSALKVPMKGNTSDKAETSEVAALKSSLESLQQDLSKAEAALEVSTNTQQEQMAQLESASSALQAVHAAVCQGDAGQAASSSAGIGIKVIVVPGARVAPEDLEAQATAVAANLHAQIEELSRQVFEANTAAEKAASSASSELAKLHAQLEEQGRVQEESNRQIDVLMNACKAADKQAADIKVELDANKANQAKRRISWDEKALSNDELQSHLKEANKQFDVAVERAEQLEGQLKEKNATERQQMMALEEARNAVTRMYSAICNQSALGPVGGVGISLGAAEVSVKGKKKNVIKINGMAKDGAAALTGLVQIGDLLLEVDGSDISKLDAKSAKELVKGPPGSVVR